MKRRPGTSPILRAALWLLAVLFFVGWNSGELLAQAPVITTTALPGGVVGQQYPPQALTAGGGTTPYSWSINSGSLPPGLTLSSDGVISGYPTTTGDFFFILAVQDARQQTGLRSLQISISPKLSIPAAMLPVAVTGVFYNFQIQATGPSPLNWSVISGMLPPGVSMTQTGLLTGTPAVPGVYPFTLQATASNPAQTASQAFQITVNRRLTIATPAALPFAVLAIPYSASLTASGGLPPYMWSNLGGPLPPGLKLSDDGTLSGIPVSLGNFILTLQVADSFNPENDVTRTFTLPVVNGLSITTLSLPNAIQNSAYSQQLQSSGGVAPFTWVVTSGTLPAGMTLTSEGLLQGTPIAVGSTSIAVTVTDSTGMSNSRSFDFIVDTPLAALTAPSIPATLSPRSSTPIQLSLASPHPSPLSGQLTLSFSATAEVQGDDPMTQFSSGSRVVKFTIPANSTTAVFDSRIMLLTGTVAGNVNLTATFDNGPSGIQVSSVPIVGASPQITNVVATRTAGGLELRITGYSPVRRVTGVEFIFNVKNSQQGVTLTRDVDTDFGAWYRNPASSAFGSAFSFVQSFAVQGDTSSIESVSVRLSNAQGSASSAMTPFQ